MNALITYLLQSTISLTVFYLFYLLLYRREAYFQFVRYYFLFAIFISSLLPILNIDLNQFIAAGTGFPIIVSPIHNIVQYTLQEVTIYPDGVGGENAFASMSNSPLSIIFIIYIIGVVISSCLFMLRLFQISRLFKKFDYELKSDSLIINIPESTVFSFFSYIFMDDKGLDEKDREKVIAHEKVHIQQKHTLDLIIAEIFVIIQWYNPLAYLLKMKIKENHEFIADSDVVGLYADSLEYSRLLIDKSSIIKTNILTHNFSYSLLKRRLFMIKKTKNPQLFSLKLLGVAMAISIVVFACSGPVSNDDVGLRNDDKTAVSGFDGNNDVFTVVEEMPTYDGGMDALIEYLSSNINYPQEAKDNDIQGRVIVNFIVDKDGSVTNTKIEQGIGSGCDEEALRVVSSMPNWIPGKQKGEAVKVSYNLPIKFKLDEKEEVVFKVVEVMPSFPGGQDAMMKYLGENIKYPEEAKTKKVQGRVFVTFVVEKDGSVNEVKLLRGIGSGCDEESMRVIKAMPNWTPGTQKGEAVRVQYNLPIKFALQ